MYRRNIVCTYYCLIFVVLLNKDLKNYKISLLMYQIRIFFNFHCYHSRIYIIVSTLYYMFVFLNLRCCAAT